MRGHKVGNWCSSSILPQGHIIKLKTIFKTFSSSTVNGHFVKTNVDKFKNFRKVCT